MSLFRKPVRNFRKKKIVDNDSEEEKDEAQMEDIDTGDSRDSCDIPDSTKKNLEKKKTKKHKSSVLSFEEDHDEDVEIFKIKKSSYSKKIAKQLKKEKQVEETHKVKDSSDLTDGLKKSVTPPVKKEDSDEEAERKIRQLREEFRTLNGDEAAALDEESDEDDILKKMMKRGEIPDANMIHAIRKQRQMARELGDYVPIDDTVKLEKNASRLVRDDDNDKSDDEEGRIDFTINTHAIERQKMKDDFLAAEHGSDEEGSEHEREWEEQQIRKGVSIQQGLASTDVGGIAYGMTAPEQIGMYSNGYTEAMSGSVCQPKFQPFIPLNTTNSDIKDITMEAIIKRLRDRLSSMDEVHRSHEQERESLVTNIADTEKSIDNCNNSCKSLEDRFRFFQEMRGYVRDLVECLNEKVPAINQLETRMHNILQGRATKLISRRQQDVRDQCQDYMTNKTQVVMESSEDQAKQRRIAEREARRARRRRARENKNIVGHHDGLSSDDEENQSEITKFNLERDDIFRVKEDLFEDVMEDFKELDAVRERFSQWKLEYGETYKEAYIGLCLPKLVNPFVRLQLLDWNPLEENCADFEEKRWFECLLFYGFKEGEPIDKEDDDVKLLPSIVEKILIPKLAKLAELVWDPLSTAQTSRLVNLVQKLQRDCPSVNRESKNIQVLLRTLVSRMKKTLDDDIFMPLYPKQVLENRNSGPSVFFHRQSWICIKLLGNILSWHGILANKVLQGLGLDGILNRYIILGLHSTPFNTETLQKCQAIVSTFPKQWFSDMEGDKTLPQLENLCRFLMYAASILDKASNTPRDSERKEYRDQIKQISKMLVNIHAMDHAVDLSNKYSFKIN
ncbi:hypothetical protein CHS0354_032273 [Potamilus streckersoni]|uniref:GCF C-terminal domain-containing protein n=1 Tax=Potamilus streckersoni TaxID=2493646 RepID=A0AAE0VGV1_9BIVA|nr:hypothetical protein CHS0354_032273 [Potamilus streckersoni]